jgi:exportin-7
MLDCLCTFGLQEVKIAEQALSLSSRCLNFDFIGTNPDESAEDVGTIQVPNTWRTVIQVGVWARHLDT